MRRANDSVITTRTIPKLMILNLLEKNNMTPLPLINFENALGESRFKTNKLLTEVIDEVHTYSSAIVEQNTANQFTAYHVNTEIVNQFKLFYLKTSPLYRLFLFYFNEENNLPLLSKELAISTASTYSYINQLNTILAPWEFQVKKKKLQGEEQHLRFLTFELIQFYYKGIEFPFTSQSEKFSNQILSTLSKFLDNSLPHSSRLKLTHFIRVATQRLKIGKTIETLSVPVVSLNDKLTNDRLHSSLLGLFKVAFPSVSEKLLANECALLCAFIYAENLAPKQWYVPNLPKELISHRQDFLEGINHLLIEDLKPDKIQEIALNLDRIFYKYNYFNYIADSFDDTTAFKQFQELYPAVSDFIMTFLKDHLYEFQSLDIYYDLLFTLTTSLPADCFSLPLYICVDFSKGQLYNNYIKERIAAFNSLTIIFESHPSEKTALYLSDFAHYQIDSPQIIWKNPPTVNDWNTLGNTIVALKQEDLNQ